MDSQSKREQEIALKQIIVISAVIAAGFLLQIFTGSVVQEILAAPVSIILSATILSLLFIKQGDLLQQCGSARVSLVLIATLLIVSLLMGIIPGNTIKYSWPFALIYLMILVNLSLATGRRLRRFRLWGDLKFILFHLGLLILLIAAGPGSGDTKRYFITVREGDTEWRGVVSGGTEVEELPVALALLDFDMEEYPPKIALIERSTGTSLPAGKPEYIDAAAGNRGVIGEWSISVDSFEYPKMKAPVAHITVKKGDGVTINGIVSCGNYFQPYHLLDVDSVYSFAMTYPEPQNYTSHIEIYTKSGLKKNGTVEVNHPLTAGFWKIYQYSYNSTMGRDSEISQFELVYDPWLIPAYIGIVMVMLGSLLLIIKGGESNGVE